MSLLVEIARAPRPIGSPEHARVRASIEARLRSLGLDPRLQTATSGVVDGGALTAATVRNILARVPGTASTGTILVTAHYDSTPLSAGAGDDGVGVAAVLETVRAVLAGPPLRNDLVVLFTDGEELGQLGARAFVGAHPWMADVRLALVAEMRGLSGPVLVLERVPDNGALVAALARADARPAATSLFRELSPRLPGGTDLDAFAVPGVPVLAFTALGGRASHHQAADRSENVSERTLQHEGQQLLSMTRELGRTDLAGPALAGPPRAYLSLPLAGLIHYPTRWVVPIDVGLVLAWLIVLFLFRSVAGRPKRAIAGAAFGLGAVLLSAAAGWGLLVLLRSVHPEYGTVPTAVYHDGYQLAALVALTVTVVVGAYILARPRFGSTALFVGALAVPLGLAIWLSVSAPFAAPVAQLPLALALMCAGPVAVVAPRDRRGGWARAGFLAAAAGILLVLVPAVELTAGVLTLRAAPLLAAAIAAGLILLLPTVDWLLRPRKWWAPTLSAAFAVTLLVLGSPKVQRGWRHPVQTSLAYLVDDTAEIALDASAGWSRDRGASDTASTPVRRTLGRWLTVPGAGAEWARSWVAEPAAPGTSPGSLLLPAADRWEVAGSGPGSEIPLPRVRVLSDTVDAGRRHVRLAVRPGLGGEMVGIHIPDGVPAEVVTACDWRATGGAGGEPVRSLTFWGQPDGGEIEVALDADADVRSLSVELIEHHMRPTEVLGEDFFRRADSLIPDASTGSDRVVRRTLLRLSTRG